MSSKKTIVKLLSAFIGLVVVAALVIGARTFTGGNLTRARQIAARLQASAIANPNPVASSAPATSQSGASTTAPAAPAARPAGSATTAGAASASTSMSGASAKVSAKSSKTAAAGGASTTSAPSTTSKTGGAAVVSSPVAGPVVAPRRQPTGAEVAQAITAVHSLLPFFTPTPAQIASAGNQVCTALDQGEPFSQVASQALDMVGAGSLSWMIPASVPEVAIKTLVALYCPGNASKLP